MKPETAGARADVSSCPSCHAALVPGMRFCRMCGYRLGEGVEEYAETRRFDGKMPTMDAPPRASGPAPAQGAPFQPASAWGAMTPVQPLSAGQLRDSTLGRIARTLNPFRLGWMFWVILAVVVFTAGGLAVRQAGRNGAFGGRAATAPAPQSSIMAEADGFTTADGGGAMLDGLAGPNTSLERAGLIGGDIITKFGDRVIRNERDMRRAAEATPPGQTVEVEFIRESEAKKAVLVTADRRDFSGMRDIEARPGGRGRIAVDVEGRVRVPGTANSYGVQIDVSSNGPADLAGLKDDDIVTDFNGKPVRTPGDLRLRIYEAMPGSTVPVVVVRGGERMEIPVKMGRSRD